MFPESVKTPKKKWTLKKFDTFEEMEMDQLKQAISLSPIEGLLKLKKLTLAAFGFSDEAQIKKKERIIKF